MFRTRTTCSGVRARATARRCCGGAFHLRLDGKKGVVVDEPLGDADNGVGEAVDVRFGPPRAVLPSARGATTRGTVPAVAPTPLRPPNRRPRGSSYSTCGFRARRKLPPPLGPRLAADGMARKSPRAPLGDQSRS